MPSDSGDSNNRRATKAQTAGAPPPEQEHIPCPRCESTNTKFCYYNNYNFSQPRHFCKSCRRYWTHGGALRDIPVGGGSRKNAKRSRTSSANSAGVDHHALTSAPVFMPVSSAQNGGGSVNFGGCGGGVKVNMGNGCGGGGVGSGFTSLLNTQPGFLALGGFGFGLASGFEEMGFGFGRAVWPFGMGSDGGAPIGANGAGYGMMNAWQFENGETGGLVNVVGNGGGDFCSWPELAISTPGNGLK